MELELERVVHAPRPLVFAAFTQPETLARWWGPSGFAIPSVDLDARPAAAYRIEMQPPDGPAFFLRGEFEAVDPPERLAFTFAWEDPDPDDVETLVDLRFAERGDATAVRLSQGPFRTEARRELHRGGWGDSFDKLERLMSARS